MAMISCPECGREISDKAASCPSCGYRLGRNGKIVPATVSKKQPVECDVFFAVVVGIICMGMLYNAFFAEDLSVKNLRLIKESAGDMTDELAEDIKEALSSCGIIRFSEVRVYGRNEGRFECTLYKVNKRTRFNVLMSVENNKVKSLTIERVSPISPVVVESEYLYYKGKVIISFDDAVRKMQE